MATGKKYYWIKLKTDFMTSDKVDYLMSQTNGAEYVVLYQMLCMKCINTDGLLARQIGEVIIPFDAEKIARDCKYFSVDTVKQAFHLFIQLGMIYQESNGYLRIADFENMVGSETDWAMQKKKQKENGLPKLTIGITKRVNENSIRLPNGKIQFVDEKRYGGNGAVAYDLSGCICEKCGSNEDLLIHHNNGFSNNVEDLVVLCQSCHGVAHNSFHNGVLTLNEMKYRHYGEEKGGKCVENGVEKFHTDIRERDKILDIDNINLTPSKKSKPTKQHKELTDFQKINNTYYELWTSLYSRGLVNTEKPIIPNFSVITNLEKSLLKSIPVETVINAIKNCEKNDFVKQNGYSFQIILSGNVMNQLVNGQTNRKTALSKCDQVTDNEVLF